MFQTFKNAWKIADLRKKILFTFFIILIFRIGAAVPVPFLDKAVLAGMIGEGSLFGYFDILTGGAFANATIFALSVTPYINASIIINLLTIAIPVLERLSKEGEEGKKKIQKITRFATLALAIITAVGYYIVLNSHGAVTKTGGAKVFAAIVIITTFVAGAMLVMWLGDQCTAKGVGNGISMLIFAGIISRGPQLVKSLIAYIQMAISGETKYFILVPVMVILFAVVVLFIIFMTVAERRIPIQYAKRVVGRKMYGGQSTNLPIKVNMSGVLPVIFASAFLSIPTTIKMFVNVPAESGWNTFFNLFSYTSWLYALLYLLLIIAFNYFYVAVQYNPIEIANNLRRNNGGIPGIRPGKPTSDFIAKVVSKITLIGAIFLAIVATAPIILGTVTGMNLALSGTSIIIIVGVALETTKSMESQMMMRHYKGFLE